MPRVEREAAFVLHSRPYRETSVLLELVTAGHGRVGLVARGVRVARPRWPRGLLAPFAPLEVAWQARGELGTLQRAEPAGAPWRLLGDALFAALYLNELLLRLLPRFDPHPEVFARYMACLGELQAKASRSGLAWAVRRFERDLLAELGYGLMLGVEAGSGAPLEAERRYRYEPEHGPLPAESARGIDVSGAALLALAGEAEPEPALALELRRLLRAVIAHQLGGRVLNAWQLDLPGPRPERVDL